MSDVTTMTRLAKVVHVVDPDYTHAPVEVVINRGARQGVKPGDRFLVFAEGPSIADPDTGENLGSLEIVRGRGEVVHVQENLATIRTTERRQVRPTKRTIRESTGSAIGGIITRGFGPRGGTIVEEELPPETEAPFDAVRIGDFAKPI